MIPEAIIGLITTVLTGLLSLFPSVDSSTISAIDSAYSSIRSLFASSAWLIPTNVFFQVLSMIVIIEFSVLVVRFLRWLINLLSVGLIKT